MRALAEHHEKFGSVPNFKVCFPGEVAIHSLKAIFFPACTPTS